MIKKLKKILKSPRLKELIVDIIDPFFSKKQDKVIFVVQDKTVFSGNIRVMCERYTKTIDDKVYLYKDGKCLDKVKSELRKIGVTVLDGFSFASLYHIVTAGVVFLSHNPRNIHISKKFKNRLIINLWHGVAIKRIEKTMFNIPPLKQKLLDNHAKLYDMVIASSDSDKETNIKAFGIAEDKVKVTGLPRYEILKKSYKLDALLSKEESDILKIKNGRKLVLYAPTFRELTISSLKQISEQEWRELEKFAEENNILFGIRPHPYDMKSLPESIQNSKNFYLFSSDFFTEVNILLKHVDLLIVDFTSVWVDYLLLNKPIIGFAKDYKHYLENERGFIYDFENIFPDVFVSDIVMLISVIQKKLTDNSTVNYINTKKVLHKFDLQHHFTESVFNEVEKMRRS